MIDGNFGNVSAGVCFPKSHINENGGSWLVDSGKVGSKLNG